jgi:SAM-dependent methyltransferase
VGDGTAAWREPSFVCPACRGSGIEARLDRELRCSNSVCAQQHDWLTAGIPIVGTPAVRARIHASDAAGPLPRDGELARWLTGARPDSPAFAALSRAAIFLLAIRDDARESFYADLCEALLPPGFPIGEALDLGCVAGNLMYELARRGAESVVGLELDAHVLRWAERAAPGGEFEAPVRTDAGHFGAGRMRIAPLPADARLTFVAGDAMDPPFGGGEFDLVTLVNLIDSVPKPTVVLEQAARLVRPGGHLLFASPDSWNGATTPITRWLAFDEAGWDGAFERAGLETVTRIDDLEWRLRDTPRLHHLYRVHGRLLRKATAPPEVR